MHYLDFSGERMLPTISDASRPAVLARPERPASHGRGRCRSARDRAHNYTAASGNWRHQLINKELVWAKAIHRVAAEGISPEQAVDEAIARIKQILAE